MRVKIADSDNILLGFGRDYSIVGQMLATTGAGAVGSAIKYLDSAIAGDREWQ